MVVDVNLADAIERGPLEGACEHLADVTTWAVSGAVWCSTCSGLRCIECHRAHIEDSHLAVLSCDDCDFQFTEPDETFAPRALTIRHPVAMPFPIAERIAVSFAGLGDDVTVEPADVHAIDEAAIVCSRHAREYPKQY
jgi:hypothetical protein